MYLFHTPVLEFNQQIQNYRVQLEQMSEQYQPLGISLKIAYCCPNKLHGRWLSILKYISRKPY